MKTSVPISAVTSSPLSTSGPSYQKDGALDLLEVANDQPVEGGEGLPVQARVGGADRRVLAEQEVALDLAVEHVERRLVGGVAAVDPRQVVEAVVVVGGRGSAEPGLQQADRVGVHVAPVAGLGRVHLEEVLERLVRVRVRHRDVAGEDVVERRDVGRALDRGMTAQRHDPAAGTAHVAEQQLDDRCGPDVLDADGVLGPADRVDEGGGALAARVRAERLGDLEEGLLRHTADLGDLLRRVAAEVALEDLKDAARILESRVGLRRIAA